MTATREPQDCQVGVAFRGTHKADYLTAKTASRPHFSLELYNNSLLTEAERDKCRVDADLHTAVCMSSVEP